MALVAALFLLVPSAARAAGTNEILRDCYDDGMLQGNYTTSQLRAAQDNLPTDLDEYSDCRDVLSRAIAAKTSSTKDRDPTAPSAGANHSGGGSAGAGTSSTPSSAGSAGNPSVAADPGIETGPTTPQEWQTVNRAQADGNGSVNVAGRDISPLLAADVGRNGVPTSLVVALALVSLAVLVALLSPLRRRVGGSRS